MLRRLGAVLAGLMLPMMVCAQTSSDHWSFQPLARPVVPEVAAATELDKFVLSAQQQVGLRLNPAASKATLARRLYLNLWGLPPTPSQLDAFANNPDTHAYAQLVEQLLESEHYGERWGRHWLDVARYGDSNGYRYDDDNPQSYTYRDFVIRATNADMPFDQFIQWQLAGDELAPGNPEALAATGFCAVGPKERFEGNARNKLENRANELDDIVSTTFAATLGLSLNCARCHDHKFDPITQAEYYQLTTVFATAQRRQAPLLTDANRAVYQAWQDNFETHNNAYQAFNNEHKEAISQAIQDHKTKITEEFNAIYSDFVAAWKQANPEQSLPEDPKYYVPVVSKHGEAFIGKDRTKRLRQLFQQRNKIRHNNAAFAENPDIVKQVLNEQAFAKWETLKLARDKAKNSKPQIEQAHVYTENTDAPVLGHILLRGDVEALGDLVDFGVIQSVTQGGVQTPDQVRGGLDNKTYQRAALAQWLTDTQNGAGGMLARVTVNRIWQHHFGYGLVSTPNDFGTQGDRPAIPELLDYLANQFIDSGWSMKAMHRLILNSAVYQQSSEWDADRARLDGDNRLHWYFKPVRLEAEILRDSMLAVSGTLNPEMYGPGVFLPVPKELVISRLGQAYPSNIKDTPQIRRRSVYTFIKRTVPVPMFQIFDGADPSASCGRRIKTTVAPQALMLMNDSFVRTRSEDFAKKIRSEMPEAGHTALINAATQQALGRLVREQESKRFEAFLKQQTNRHGGNDLAALTDFCQVLFASNEFLYVD